MGSEGARDKIWKKLTAFYHSKVMPGLYWWYARKPVKEHFALFVDAGHGYSSGYQSVALLLQDCYRFEIGEISRNDFRIESRAIRQRGRRALKLLAQARFVFLQSESFFIGRLSLRSETEVIQLWHACGAFKKVGADLAKMRGVITHDYWEFYGRPSKVIVSSPYVIDIYDKFMQLEGRGEVCAWGNPRTDIYFDEQFLVSAREHLESRLPAIRGKNILLYAPTFRNNTSGGRCSPELLDYRKAYELLGDRYVLLVRQHPDLHMAEHVPKGLESWLIPVNDYEIELLLCAANILISDYSSIIFEYSLLNKPMAFFAPDLESFGGDNRFFFPYRDIIPGPLFADTVSLWSA